MKALKTYKNHSNNNYVVCLLVIEVICNGKPVKAAICKRMANRYVNEEIVLLEQDYWHYWIEMVEESETTEN